MNKKGNIEYEYIDGEIKKLNAQIKEIYMKLNQKEDDLKNIINEKEILINKMNNKIMKQEEIINDNKNKIVNLNNAIIQMNKKYNEEQKKNANNINTINKLLKDIHKNYNELKQMNNNVKKQLKNKVDKENNYISLKLLINKEDIGKDIFFLNQFKSYKFNSNFEPDDIIITIDNENIPIKYKCLNESVDDKKDANYYDKANNIYNELNKNYKFYWNFLTEGIHNVKIIFNKKIMTCEEMFNDCRKIIEIDCSRFKASKVTSCKNMFLNCSSLKKIDFGLLDFSFCSTYESMFFNCSKLEDLDVSKFNTKNSLSFKNMFFGCSSLKVIDVSKFDSSKCENIIGMFYNCENITEINMINWNMKNIKNQKDDIHLPNLLLLNPNPVNLALGVIGAGVLGVGVGALGLGANIIANKFKKPQLPENISGIERLFYGCKNLNNIKMNTNFNEISELNNTNAFKGISKYGSFIWKNGYRCDAILNKLPECWNKTCE